MTKLFTRFRLFLESRIIDYKLAQMCDYPDIKRIANQHRKFLPAVMRVQIEDSISRGEVIVAKQDKVVIGFINFHKRKDNITTVYDIAVDRDYSKIGIGTKLLSMLDKPIQLKVTQDNPANDFYKKLGFQLVKTVKGKKRSLNLYFLSDN